MREVEQVMRTRHGLRLDEPNDFDLVTADAVLELWDQISAATFLAQVTQHALCNRLHSVEQRLAKWLLGVHDRIESSTIRSTHDFLAQMMGTRRPGVTVAIGDLALAGLVSSVRNAVTITDRAGLEQRSCECYAAIVSDAKPFMDRLNSSEKQPSLVSR